MLREVRPGPGGWLVVVLALTVVVWVVRPQATAHHSPGRAALTVEPVVLTRGMRPVEDLPVPSVLAPTGGVAALTITVVPPPPPAMQMSLVYPGHYIKMGDRGPLVSLIQRTLHINADGVFGVKTAGAVIKYQSANGLHVDGIVGPQTWNSLFSS